MAEIELLGAWKGKTKKKFAIGVVSHRTLNAETPAEVADEIRKALKYMNIENLLVTSDCGFGRQGANRMVAFYKSRRDRSGRKYRPPRVWPAGNLCALRRSAAQPGCGPGDIRRRWRRKRGARRAFEPSAPSAAFARPRMAMTQVVALRQAQRFSELLRERR